MMYKNEECAKKIQPRESGKISMVELFDMLAGSETGAILASTLAIKNDDAKLNQANKYFADKVVSFFDENMDTIYKDKDFDAWVYILIICISMVFFGVISYFLTQKIFNIKGFED